MQEARVAFFLAVRTLVRAQKSSTILLVFILFLSFLNLMFITGILAGVSAALIQQSIETSTSYIDVDPPQAPIQQSFIPNELDLRSRLAAVDGVIATARHYSTTGTLAYDRDRNGHAVTMGVPVIGIDPSEERDVTTIADYMVAGTYLDEGDTDQIVIGSDVAGGYGLTRLGNLGNARPGDRLQLTYANGVSRSYTIKGIYRVGFSSNYVFVPYKELEAVLGVSNYASEILIRVDPGYESIDQFKQSIEDLAPNLKISTYAELLGQLAPITLAFDVIGVVVAVVSVVVAAITIFVMVYVNAISKRRQIGILKAIGVSQNTIVLSYVFQSLFFSACGVVSGTLVVFLALDPYLRENPILLPFGRLHLAFSSVGVAVSVVSILLAGVVAGFVPSWNVARQNIISAIWGS